MCIESYRETEAYTGNAGSHRHATSTPMSASTCITLFIDATYTPGIA